jgi:hypothetical protein
MNVLTNKIKGLPIELSREIFSFLIPDIDKIIFNIEPPFNYSSYNIKFDDVAYFRDERISNINKIDEYTNSYYLSRIVNKNGNNLYYLTKETLDCIQAEYENREIDIFYYDHDSHFLGNDLFNAIFYTIYNC